MNAISLASEEGKTNVETIQYIVIRLGDEQFGIDIKYIDNIVRMQSITRVPKVQDYLLGVINLRGEVIPVMSLRRKMSLADDEFTKATRIIILKLENQGNVGVIVDEVKEVVTLAVDEIDKVQHKNGEAVNFVSGVGKHENELISILDLGTLASEDGAQ
ncbi:MAG: purine-binding chemotaxis protein CheW [Lachnospiraceae bacterium]|nr:purine-binding chemotaxis protein CheW [Lachnospiraceae bacterium]